MATDPIIHPHARRAASSDGLQLGGRHEEQSRKCRRYGLRPAVEGSPAAESGDVGIAGDSQKGYAATEVRPGRGGYRGTDAQRGGIGEGGGAVVARGVVRQLWRGGRIVVGDR